MDAQGVAVHALSLQQPDGLLGGRRSLTQARPAWNDGAIEAHQGNPDRFVVLADSAHARSCTRYRRARPPWSAWRLHGDQRRQPWCSTIRCSSRFRAYCGARPAGLPIPWRRSSAVSGCNPMVLLSVLPIRLTQRSACHLIFGGGDGPPSNLQVSRTPAACCQSSSVGSTTGGKPRDNN